MRRALVTGIVFLIGDRGNGDRVRTGRDRSGGDLAKLVTAGIKQILVELQQAQRRQLRRMARRLSMFSSLEKYAVADPPRWRTRRPGSSVRR